MRNLKFTQLLVLSTSNNSANQFRFSPSLNLITSKDNSAGKSTVVKLLFWGLGCEPELDHAWKSLDCKTLVEFQIGSKSYSVKRYKNSISIKDGINDYQSFTKITGEYSKVFADIVGFKALLPNRESEDLEVPPPSYYFLPFYIDQK